MTDTPKPPARRPTPARTPKPRKVRMEYMEIPVAEGEPLEIPVKAGVEPPEVQVLSVDRQEGSGFGQYVNRWRVVVVWR